jgi:MerR family transcriptional regulator, light-induced transcriptional regulator
VQGDTLLRIGELSRRSGASPELLRAWERRYGLLRPIRSPGGIRLYSLADLDRVHRMRRHLACGIAAAQAAAAVLRSDAGPLLADAALDPAAIRHELARTLDAFDEPNAHTVIDLLLTAATIDTALTQVVLPYLHDLGDRWARGDASIAQEHFAATLIRGRLLGLARGWSRGLGPLALLACLPDEQHDLGLLSFGLLLRTRGWRIADLGADMPLPTLANTIHTLQPHLTVVATVTPKRITPHQAKLRTIAERHPIFIGGAGATQSAAQAAGVTALPADPLAAAEAITQRAGDHQPD